MIDKIVNSPYLGIMETAIEAANKRQRVISDNIANVNTPGFKKNAVEFESLLAGAITPPKKEKKLELVKTNSRHLPLDKENVPVDITPQVHTITDTTMRTDGNNVDIEKEMAEMAKNSIYYNANIRQLSSYMSNIKTVLTQK